MRKLDDIRAKTSKAAFFRGQAQHAMLAVLLSVGAMSLMQGTGDGLWGISALCWAKITIGTAILHQVMVALVWRLQIHFAAMTRIFGASALRVWGALFLPLLFARPALLVLSGIADTGSLPGNRMLHVIAGTALLVPAGWGAYSVVKYFTVPRALGGDHFFDEYLNMPLVRKGAFKYSSNAMYGIVFLGLWGIALLTGSWNAVVLALFQHAYIWVHMYCTEDPDMQILYNGD
jgi:hypothetical protein